ncbi:MAG: S8 family serine peptidase [Anaerolineae bacterium]|nr:S8 family serine peptidase [Anaerolineae bacterium]
MPEAHQITRGDRCVVVAVSDLGYRPHPDHRGHLWVNPRPTRGDIHGWDFADGDASLEYAGPGEESSENLRGHHSFVVGEVAAVAPECPIMVLRVGYATGQTESWWRAVDYAVEHGAKVIVEPHGYIHGQSETGTPWFYQGTDFAYPHDNPRLRRAYEQAYSAGCLIVKGVCDNRGRRVAAAVPALDAVMAVGSSSRQGVAANIAPDSDYVEVTAPSGSRDQGEGEQVRGTGGDDNYIFMSGGCMASGFAGGVAALVFSQYPGFTGEQVRQVMRNTARGVGWDRYLGHGILDASAAVSLKDSQLTQRLAIDPVARLDDHDGRPRLLLDISNRGVFDVARALVTVYNGNPCQPADPAASRDKPHILLVRQLGHAILPVTGLEKSSAQIELADWNGADVLYAQVCVLDLNGPDKAVTARLRLTHHNHGLAAE